MISDKTQKSPTEFESQTDIEEIKQRFTHFLEDHWRDNIPYFHYSMYLNDFLQQLDVELNDTYIPPLRQIGYYFTNRLLRDGVIKFNEDAKYEIIPFHDLPEKIQLKLEFREYLKRHWNDHPHWYSSSSVAYAFLQSKNITADRSHKCKILIRSTKNFTHNLVVTGRIEKYTAKTYRILNK